MPELTNYTGNAGLSYGSNAGIPVISEQSTNLNVIQDTANRIMLANHQNNVNLFKQKIDDRDALLGLLDKGQVVVGDIDPMDKPYFEKYKKAQNDAFYKMAQNGGVNNKEAYRDYIKSTTDLKDAATHVQARKIGIDQYKKDLANEPIKAKQERLRLQLKKQLEKGSGAMIDPFQTSLDYDADKHLATGDTGIWVGGQATPMATSQTVTTKSTVGKPLTTTTTQRTAPIKGKASQVVTQTGVGGAAPQIVYKNGLPYSVNKTHVDFNRIKQNYNDDFLEATGEGVELQRQFYDKFTDPDIISHPEIIKTYDNMVTKAEEYNRARGFIPLADGSMSAEDLKNGAADPKKLKEALSAPLDPKTGRRQINMSKPELSAYFKLAHMDNYATQNETLLKDEATLGLQGLKVRGELAIKNADAASKRELRNAQIKKINKAIEGKSEMEQQQEFNKYWAANGASILNSQTTFGGINGTIPIGAIPYKQSRPVYTTGVDGQPKLLKPIGGVPIYDTYKYNAEGELTGKSKVIGFEGGHYETQFYNKATGQNIGVDNIQTAFKKAKKGDPSLTEQQFLINLGDNGITYRMLGENGTSANVDDNGNNLRVLNNKYKTKGEQDPILSDIELFDQNEEE